MSLRPDKPFARVRGGDASKRRVGDGTETASKPLLVVTREARFSRPQKSACRLGHMAGQDPGESQAAAAVGNMHAFNPHIPRSRTPIYSESKKIASATMRLIASTSNNSIVEESCRCSRT